MTISDIDDNWYAMPESVKFSLWLSASSLALSRVGDPALAEWDNIITRANATKEFMP